MKFHTNISRTEDNTHLIRGHNLIELIEKKSLIEVIFLLLRGDLPSKKEGRLLEAALVACTENGLAAPSIFIPRVIASTGNAFQTALAGGILAIGEYHGGAAEAAAKILVSDKTPAEIVTENKIVPGFGHKIYKTEDPRAAALYKLAKKLKFSGRYFEKAYAVEKELEKQKNRKLPLNIDGALAACLLELKLDPRLGKALFILARVIGISAHILEEFNQKNSYYRLEEGEVISH